MKTNHYRIKGTDERAHLARGKDRPGQPSRIVVIRTRDGREMWGLTTKSLITEEEWLKGRNA